jgi:RNA polymerase-binding transcription factor
MNDKTAAFEETFLHQQQARLVKLHTELSGTTVADELEERDIQNHSLGEAHETEDDAQRLDFLDTEAALITRSAGRLPMIERALKKIEDGTYGFSDVSGKAIPRDRLEAIPEAICTADEEAARQAVR